MFLALCEEVEYDSALQGDLAIMARGMIGMVNDKKPGGLQEYINVAKQAMMPYAKSGILHKLTEKSTFRYRDLKYKDARGVISRSTIISTVRGAWCLSRSERC